MFSRVAQIGVLAALGLLVSACPAEAFGRHRATTTVYCPCYCECFGPVYVASPPPVPLNGPFPTLLRVVQFGKGIIVEVDEPAGTNPQPSGLIQVISRNGPEVKYEGYNRRELTPGVAGGIVRYSVFLLPTKPGKVEVEVGFVMSNNTIRNVPFAFDIVPVVYQP